MSDTTTWGKAYMQVLLGQPDSTSVRALVPLSLSSEQSRSGAPTLRQMIDQAPRILVVGPAGSGKSTALRQLALQLAEAKSKEARSGRGKQPIPLPLYVDMAQYEGSLEQTIASMYRCGKPPAWGEFASQGLLFLVDGLERLPSESQLSVLSQLAATMSTLGTQARWVLSCRSEALPLFRPWFSGAEVRAIRPIAPRDVVTLVRQRCGDSWANHLEQDDAALAMASRPRWLTALTDVLATQNGAAPSLRGQMLYAWFARVAALVGADASTVITALCEMHTTVNSQSDGWMLPDIVARYLSDALKSAVLAQQLVGAPATQAKVQALQAAVTMGVLRFDFEQQALGYAFELARSVVIGHYWLSQDVQQWTLGQVTADESALSVAIDMAPDRVVVLRRLFDLGMVRQSVKALLQTVDADQVGAMLSKSGVKQVTTVMQVAEILHEAGAPQLARQQLERLQSSNPEDRTVVRRIAELAAEMHDWPAAVQAYELVCRLDPHDLLSRERLGVVYGELGSFDAAAQSLTTLLDVYRRQGAQVAKQLGLVYVKQMNYPRALEMFDQALRDVSDDADVYRAKSTVLEALNRYDEASQVLLDATQRMGEDASLLAALGRVKLAQGDVKSAKTYLSQAIDMDGTDALSHATLGRVYLEIDDSEAASVALSQAVRLQPDNDELYVYLGTAYERQNDLDAAIVALRRAVQLRPASSKAPRMLAQLLERRGDGDEALQVIRTALKHIKDDDQLYADLAGLLWQRGEHDTALTTYRKAVTLAPHQTQHIYAMAKSLSELGRYREAIEAYNQALGLAGDNPDIVVDAVQVYEQQGLHHQAENIIDRALVQSDDVRLLQAAAGFALRRGHVPKARSYLAKALRQDRHNDTTWYHVACVHLAESLWSLALFALQRVKDQYAPHILAVTAQARAGLGMIDGAIAAFENALKYDGNMVSTRVAYSKALAQFGRYEPAYEQSLLAYQSLPSDVDTLVQLATMALKTQRPNEALEYIDEAYQIAPRRIDVLCQRSQILCVQRTYDEALVLARQALDIDGQSVAALVATATALQGLNRQREALVYYQQALELDANNEQVLAGIRDVSLQLNEITGAADAAQRLVSMYPKSAQHHLRLGEVLVALNVPEAALIELQQAIDLDRMQPQAKQYGAEQTLSAQAYARMSAAYAKSARWSEARECAESAIQRAPDCADHHALLGDALLGLGQRIAAIDAYRKAVEYRPDNAQWQYLLGYLLQQSGADREAVTVLQNVVALTDRAEHYHTLGLAHLAVGDSKQAIRMFSKAIQKRPDAHHWRADLADVHASRGWYAEAIAEIDQALQDAGDHPVLWRKRAELHYRNQHIEAAADDIVEALRRDANDGKALTLMSKIMQRKGMPERALEAAERAVQLHGNDAQARYQLATLLRAAKRHGEAIPHLIVALRLRDQESQWWVDLAESYDAVRDHVNASRCMQRAVEIEPSDLQLAYRLGELLLQAGEYAAAESELRRIMITKPTHAAVIACLAEVMMAQQQPDEALSLARRAVDLDAGHGDHWRVLAHVLRESNRYDEALEAARTAYELDNQHAPSALTYGVLLMDFGDIAEAVQVLSAAVKADDSQPIYHWCQGMALRKQVPLAMDIEEFTEVTPEQQVALNGALKAFDRALMLEGDNPRVIFERGIVLQLLGRHYEAVSSFDAAVILYGEVHPRPIIGDAAAASVLDKNDLSAHIRQRRMLSLFVLKRYAEAQDDIRYVLAIVPLSVHDLYLSGRVALALEEYAVATSALASAAANSPGNATIQMWYGMALMKVGQIPQAIGALELANDLTPNNGAINAMLRDVYIQDNRFDRAMSAAQRATRYDPGNAYNHFALGQLLYRTRRDSDARHSIINALTLKNDELEWHMLLGDICVRMGMYDNARSAYLSAKTINPNATAPHFAIAQLLVLQGRIQDAISNLEQALLLNPTNAEWHHRLGTLYEQINDVPKAREAFQRAVEYGGNKPKYYSSYAHYVEMSSDKDVDEGPVETVAIAPEPEVVQPKKPDPLVSKTGKFDDERMMYLAMGDVLFEQGSYQSALENYENSLKIDYANAEALWRLGRVKQVLGRNTDARVAYEEAIRYDGRCVPALVGLAQLAAANSQYEVAISLLRSACDEDPANSEHQIFLAEMYWANKQMQSSERLVVEIQHRVSLQPAIMHRYAEIAYKNRRYQLTIWAAEIAIKGDRQASYYVTLARAHRDNGDMSRAIAAFRRAIEIDPALRDIRTELSKIVPLWHGRGKPQD